MPDLDLKLTEEEINFVCKAIPSKDWDRAIGDAATAKAGWELIDWLKARSAEPVTGGPGPLFAMGWAACAQALSDWMMEAVEAAGIPRPEVQS